MVKNVVIKQTYYYNKNAKMLTGCSATKIGWTKHETTQKLQQWRNVMLSMITKDNDHDSYEHEDDNKTWQQGWWGWHLKVIRWCY